jgi:alpha-glucoside transport system substrate-binding protein
MSTAAASIVSTFFGDSPTPMFEDPPAAGSTSRATSSPASSPKAPEAGVDYDFFYLPPVDEAYGRPFLVAGDMIAMFNDRPEVRALMEYFTTPQSVSGWLQNGGAWPPTRPPRRTCTAWTWSAASPRWSRGHQLPLRRL